MDKPKWLGLLANFVLVFRHVARYPQDMPGRKPCQGAKRCLLPPSSAWHGVRRSLFLLFPATLLLMHLSSAEDTETEKRPEPKDWQIRGALAALEDPYPETVVLALEKLGWFQRPETIPYIVKRFRDPHENVRMAAVNALGDMGALGRNGAHDLSTLLVDRDRGIRTAAVEAMSKVGGFGKEDVADLEKLLEDQDSDTRAAAAKAIGAVGTDASGAAPKLARLLSRLLKKAV